MAIKSSYSLADARQRLAALVHLVEETNAVEITRRGKPVAVLLSVAEYERLESGSAGFWPALLRFRERHDLETLGLDEALSGLRDRSPGRRVRR